MKGRASALIAFAAFVAWTCAVAHVAQQRPAAGRSLSWFLEQPLEATYIPSLRNGVVQYGSTALVSSNSNTSSLSPSVDVAASYIVNDGCKATDGSGSEAYVFCRAELTNTSTVTITRGTNAAGTLTAFWHVVPVLRLFIKSVQTGTISLGSSASTANGPSLSPAVTINQALLVNDGCTSTTFDSGAVVGVYGIYLDFASTTAVRATRASTGGGIYEALCGYTVVDLK